MNSVQESKNELDAAIRYAENAISSAKQTIESMEFRQEMAKKTYQEQTAREYALSKREEELESQVVQLKSDRSGMQDCINLRENQIAELESKVQGDSVAINQLRRDLTVKTSQAEAWRKEYEKAKEEADELRSKVQGQYEDIVLLERDLAKRDEEKPTMPVIPKDVAIAIFREGTLFGVEAACDEIEGERINISESEYVGDFHISFERDIDLDDHIDFDWVRGKIGDYDEDNVTANLEGLCAKNNFECRIHGIDKEEEKKND
mgnify:FL=1